MYPTVVILLAKAQHSMTDVCKKTLPSISNASEFTGPVASETYAETSRRLSFAVGSVHSTTTGNEAESQRLPMLRSQGGYEHGLGEVILDIKGSQVGTSS